MHFTETRSSSSPTSTTNGQVDGVIIPSGLSVMATPIEVPSMLAVRMIRKDSFSMGYILGSTDSMYAINATNEPHESGLSSPRD